MWSKIFSWKKKVNVGTHFLWPQPQSEDKLSASTVSHKNYPLSLSQTRLLTMLFMHPVLFCYHFPHSQAPFPFSFTDGRQSQFQQSVLTCLPLFCPSPLPNDSPCSQLLQCASQWLWQLSYNFCYLVAQSTWVSSFTLTSSKRQLLH